MILLLCLYSVIKLYIVYDIYQQSHYNIKDTLVYFVKNFCFYNLIPIILFIIFSLCNNFLIKLLSLVFVILYSLVYFIELRIKLKFSRRIIRLILFSLVYLFLIIFIKYLNFYLLLLIEYSIIPLLFLDVYLAKLLNRRYIKECKDRIKNYNGTIIAITGSYGKTSVKYFFYQVLSLYFKVIATPKSYNTPLGISSFINNVSVNNYDYLILEYGASKPNDIKELCDLIKPNICVVTEVGYMHMNGFKCLENVLEEKMSICRSSDVAILNYDNSMIKSYPIENDVLSYGLKNGLYQVKNINNGEFDIYKNNELLIHLDTNLASNIQILNLLPAILFADYLKVDLKIIEANAFLFEGYKNRVEVKKIGNHTIIDDSFNSNFNGFKSALLHLSNSRGKKILLSAGIVELGKYQMSIYNELKKYIISACDVVILTGSETNYLYKILYGHVECYHLRDFAEGINLYKKIVSDEESCLLIENDVTDIYLRRELV